MEMSGKVDGGGWTVTVPARRCWPATDRRMTSALSSAGSRSGSCSAASVAAIEGGALLVFIPAALREELPGAFDCLRRGQVCPSAFRAAGSLSNEPHAPCDSPFMARTNRFDTSARVETAMVTMCRPGSASMALAIFSISMSAPF